MTDASVLLTVVGIASTCSNSKRLFFMSILVKTEMAFFGNSQIASKTLTSSSPLQVRQNFWTVTSLSTPPNSLVTLPREGVLAFVAFSGLIFDDHGNDSALHASGDPPVEVVLESFR
jgi:hypothetical protein